MTPEQVADVAREAIWVMLKIGAPAVLVALVTGVAVSLVQAVTQVQEQTLSFVPKLVAVLVTIVLTVPFAVISLRAFAQHLFDRMIAVGGAG